MAPNSLESASMLLFLGLCAPSLIMLHLFLLTPSAKTALLFHEACLSLTPDSRHRSAYQAIVCGANLPLDDFAQDFRVTGLLHILVVSGSHFVFLEQVLEFALQRLRARFKWINAVILTLLLIFALATLLQPPVVRALFSLLLNRLNSYAHFSWTAAQRITLSGLFSFAFCHDARDAHSLLLSWGAALALASCPASEASQNWTRALLKSVWIYVILAPLLAPMGAPHPGSILLNWLLAPFMGFILFPASLGAFLLPLLQTPCDWLWDAVSAFVSYGARLLGEAGNSLEIGMHWLWAYIGALTLLLLARERLEVRERVSEFVSRRK